MTRKKGKRAKDEPNLRRFRTTIQEMVDGQSAVKAVIPTRNKSKNESESESEDEFSFKKLPDVQKEEEVEVEVECEERRQPRVPRKQRRKDDRMLKKARKQAFHQHKEIPQSIEDIRPKSENEMKAKVKAVKTAEQKKKKREREKERKKEKLAAAALKKETEVEEERVRHLRSQIQDDEKMIRQLSKQMRLNKRKHLPAAFTNDGLDYLLDAVDSEKLAAIYENDSEAESDDDAPIKKRAKTKAKQTDEGDNESDTSEFSDNSGFDEKDDDLNSDDSESDDDDEGENDEESDQENVSDSESDSSMPNDGNLKTKEKSKKKVRFVDESESISKKKKKTESSDSEDDMKMKPKPNVKAKVDSKPEPREDIYGRLVDADGNVVQNTATSGAAYIPPAKRAAMLVTSEKKKVELERMNKQIKGLFNRLSESNLQPISVQIEEMYRKHSRADMNASMMSVLRSSLLSEGLMSERLLMIPAMLVAVLHANVGTEIGAFIVQEVVTDIDEYLKPEMLMTSHKTLDNLLMFLAHLYNFKVLHCLLVFDLMKRLCDLFEERHIELLLLLLKTIGFSLRKDDAASLKELILVIQTKANSRDVSECNEGSRVKFMLDVLLAIRNNNMRKIPSYDPEIAEHSRKLIRNYVRDSSDKQLRISLSDLLNCETRGRWWIVGSAWAGTGGDPTDGNSMSTDESNTSVGVNTGVSVSNDMMDLARKQRMNTDIRRDIFSIIMTSDDYCDAFEKLMCLRLTHHQEREIVHVLMECCQQEKIYNPYYSYLAQKFCSLDRRFMMTFQFTFWDKMKTLDDVTSAAGTNLSRLLEHLIINNSMSLAVFKTLALTDLDKPTVKFVRRCLLSIMLSHPDGVTKDVFGRISQEMKYKPLREGLRVFLQHFILNNKKLKVSCSADELRRKVVLAENSLQSAEVKIML